MKNKILTALLVTAVVMVAACDSQVPTPQTATSTPRLTPKRADKFTEFSLPNGSPFGIPAGPDGNLWFTEGKFSSSGQIGRIATRN